ncbi:MAG: hypothetical protein JW809_04360 [Pirellulales bacterium]|nr:hypothetical protein [Pirellulales bacterium]
MRVPRVCFGVAAATLLMASVARSDDPFRVNDYGNPKRLAFEGCQTFSEKELGSALVTNVDVALAAHPAAPLAAYLETLSNGLIRGYRHAGFPDAWAVTGVDEDAKKIRVTIDEGPRYTAGEVVVRGNREILAAPIVHWLTSLYPPEGARRDGVYQNGEETTVHWVDKDGTDVKLEHPLWKPGTPAPFDEATQTRLRRQVQRALAEQGFFFSRFRMEIAPQPDGKTAALAIDIDEEGPKAVLGEIAITGNDRNSTEEILKYLDLTPGASLAAGWQADLEHRLWLSGRFTEWQVTLDAPAAGSDRAALKLNLTESPWAPRLSEPLSPEQTVLLKLRDQLADPRRWPGDLCFSADMTDATMEVVVSPTHGVLARLSDTPKPEEKTAEAKDLSFVLSDRQCGAVSRVPLGVGFWLPTRPRMQCYGSIALGLSGKLEDRELPRRLQFGFGTKDCDEEEPYRPVRIQICAEPAYFVAEPNIEDASGFTLADGVLTCRTSTMNYRVDAVTGHLLELDVLSGETSEVVARFRFEPNAFQTRLEQVQALTADCPNLYDPDAPVSSWLGLLCQERLVSSLVDTNPEVLRWLQLVRKMHEKKVFDSLDDVPRRLDFGKKTGSGDAGEFFIPPGSEDTSEKCEEARWLVYGLCLPDALFSRHSWPWTLTREIILAAAQKGQYTQAELAALWNSDRAGPIFYLLAATTLDQVSPETAKAFANRGLERTSTVDFQNDCREWLHPDGTVGQCARRMAQAVRDLEPDEVEAILGPETDRDASPLAKCIAALRSPSDRPLDDAILAALTAAWEAGLRDQVRSGLVAIRDRDPEGSIVRNPEAGSHTLR